MWLFAMAHFAKVFTSERDCEANRSKLKCWTIAGNKEYILDVPGVMG